MRLDHTFTVPVPVDQAWDVLLDVPRIAPCMPGAALTDFDGESFNGTVKVKLGPIQLTYKGKGRFVERDEAARRVVIEASGRDVRAAGTAAATVTAVLVPDGDSTRVDVATELTVTGKPAQFGRGMLADVSGKLLNQFAECLAGQLASSSSESAPAPAPGPSPEASASASAAPGAGSGSTGSAPDSAAPDSPAGGSAAPGSTSAAPAPAGSTTAAPAPADQVEPIDLLKVTGISGAVRRYAPYGMAVIALGVLAWLVVRWLR
ncbi:MAG: SRPBCC family protein [Micromonosporaceae bacterium]|nr:SRPBCC family protein [Micromonosporaceae bacterium]